MPEMSESTSPLPPGRRQRHLPATGLPAARDDRRLSSVVSIALHALVIMLIIGPAVTHTGIVIERPQGAGGLGPAGGGGGGKRGTGGSLERVTYVRPAPPPAAVVAAVIPPPAPIPQPKPPEVKPPEVKPPEPTPPVEVKPEPKPDATSTEPTAPTVGTGGGTGRDGSNGSGPGSGGGVGSGIGTGRGSGTGPGTGGGIQANYPPAIIELFIPPLPIPAKLKGFHLVAEFDVDETGKVLDFKFTSTGDRGYDRRLDDVLKGTRFRPGTTPDGKPIRMKAQISYDF